MTDPYNTEQEQWDRTLALRTMVDENVKEAREAGKLPQWQRVLNYMQTHECITSMIAFSELNITSLHRRLTDIERNTDYVIDRKRIDVPNRPHHYEYRLL